MLSSTGHWSSIPLEKSGRQYRICLSLIPTNKQGSWATMYYQFSTYHCFMAAPRGKKSLALLACTVHGLSMLPARTQKVMGLHCIMVNAQGKAGHQQHCITYHFAPSHPEMRDSFLKCISASDTSLFNQKAMWIMLKTTLAYFPYGSDCLEWY